MNGAPAMTLEEQREYERFQANQKVALCGALSATIVDISSGGVGIEVVWPASFLTVGKEVPLVPFGGQGGAWVKLTWVDGCRMGGFFVDAPSGR